MTSVLRGFFVSCLLAAVSSVLAASEVELTLSLGGSVDIDQQGAVVDYTLTTPVTDDLRAAIDSRVRNWRFAPIRVNGVAVPARTSMAFSLRAERVSEEKFHLHFGKPTFGAPSLVPRSQRGRGAIQFPRDLARVGVGGRVMLAIRIDNEGRVVEVHPYQTSLDARPNDERQAQKLRETMERAVMRSARHWQFHLAESIDGETRGMTALIPIDFAVGPPGQSKRKLTGWRALLPGPVDPAPWQDQIPADLDLSALENGVAASLDSSFQLLASSEEG